MSDMGRGELAAAGARMAALEVIFEVEQTMKWLDTLGPRLDPPTRGDIVALKDLMEYRGQRVDAAIANLQIAVQEALATELDIQERRADL